MTEYGYTANAFVKKPYSAIYSEMESDIKEYLGIDVDTAVDTLIGAFLRAEARQKAQLWNVAEAVDANNHIDTSDGISIDRNFSILGVRRNNPTYATGEVTFTGVDGTDIPIGFQVASGDIIFEVTEAVEISGGTINADVICTQKGIIGNVGAGTITTIVESLSGVSSVTNASAMTGGAEIESDTEYKRRGLSSLATAGTATYDAIYSAILGTTGVDACAIRYNATSTTDGDGIPGHSINAVILPSGELTSIIKNAVAQTLHENIPCGIQTYGSQSGNATAVDDSTIAYSFDSATAVPMYINVTITKDATFEETGQTQIKDALIQYIGGTDSTGTNYSGLEMGESVIYTKLISKVMSITGVTDITTLEISDDNTTFVETNISVDTLEFATLSSDNINITAS